jgi:hypothetical protein
MTSVKATIACAMVAAALVPAVAGGHPSGYASVRGAIYYVGGPAPGRSVAKQAGMVTIRNASSRRFVAQQHVTAGHSFVFLVKPGPYAVTARSGDAGCRTTTLRAKTNARMSANIFCDVR